MDKRNVDLKVIKLVILGDSAVGKSAICYAFIGLEYNRDFINSIIGDKYEKKIKLEKGQEIKLILVDTAGQERFRTASLKFIKNCQGIALVFDVTSKTSFENINLWINEVKENFSNSNLAFVLLGNKIDIEKDKWQVTQEEIDYLLEKENLKYYPISVKNNEGINESFSYLANVIYNKFVIKKELKGKSSEENKKKEIKSVLKENKNEYDKLKKDYDELKKKYDKLKEDNEKLNNELNKAKNVILNFEDKVKENLYEINNLKNIILQKDDKILNLNLRLKNIESFNKKIFNNDDIIYVHFISSDQNINCPIKCLRNDTFAEVEERLYQKYQEYRETNNKFLSKGITVMRFKTIIENNITDGDKIELIK